MPKGGGDGHAAGQNSRPGEYPRSRGIAHGQRAEAFAATIPDGGDPRQKALLGVAHLAQGEGLVAIREHLADDRLVIRVRLKGQVHVGIDQTRENKLARAVNSLCPRSQAIRVGKALDDALDLVIGNEHGRVGDWLASFAVNQRTIPKNELQVTPSFSEN